MRAVTLAMSHLSKTTTSSISLIRRDSVLSEYACRIHLQTGEECQTSFGRRMEEASISNTRWTRGAI